MKLRFVIRDSFRNRLGHRFTWMLFIWHTVAKILGKPCIIINASPSILFMCWIVYFDGDTNSNLCLMRFVFSCHCGGDFVSDFLMLIGVPSTSILIHFFYNIQQTKISSRRVNISNLAFVIYCLLVGDLQ